MTYRFPGMRPFIDAAADSHGVGQGYLTSKIPALYFVGEVQSTIGQIRHDMDKSTKESMMRHVDSLRTSLLVALEAVDSAILEVCTEHDLKAPRWAAKEPLTNGTGHIRDSDRASVGDDVERSENGRPKSRARQHAGGQSGKG